MQSSVQTSDTAPECLSGAQMVVEALHREGVEHVFGYPGGAVLPLYDAFYRQTYFKHILVRHEQAALHMADAYARSTGKVGVAVVTSGPGATPSRGSPRPTLTPCRSLFFRARLPPPSSVQMLSKNAIPSASPAPA